MAIKALVFDNFGVLMDVVYGSLRHVLPVEARARLLSILDEADNGRISADDELKQIVELLNEYNLDGAEQVAKAIQFSEKNDELLNFILEKRGQYKTAMLSNVSAVIWNYYTPEQMDKYFDRVVLSYQEAIAKPDPRIYQLVCERLEVEPSECVFADDNEVNVDAANKIGMHGIVFTNNSDYFAKLEEILARAWVARSWNGSLWTKPTDCW